MRTLLPALTAVAIGLGAASPAGAAAPRPDLTLHGAISDKDLHSYLEAPFDVPEGVTRLTVEFSQDGTDQRTTIDLGVWDPQRFRGWSGGARTSFTLATSDASPSYLPGPVPSGRWRLVLGVPNIRPGVVSHYVARISFLRDGERPAVSTFSDTPLRPGPGWYRGDLHDHTGHSDGRCLSRSGVMAPCPVFKTVEAADARGLDFLVVSDHNTISQHEALRELQPYFDRTLLIPGRELTTFQGHGNGIGLTGFVDFRVDGVHVRDMAAMIEAVHAQGGLFTINHPALPSGEACMGCGWTATGVDYAKVDAVEVVNGGSLRLIGAADGALSGLDFWQSLLNRGFHPTAVGGSDNHQADLPLDVAGSLGSPTTVVFASELSERAVLAGLAAGHVFVDVDATRDRLVELTTEVAGRRAMMGDSIDLPAGTVAQVQVRVVGAAGGRIELVRDGTPLTALGLSATLGADDTRSVSLTGDGQRHWLNARVRDSKGRLILISNPLYLRLHGH